MCSESELGKLLTIALRASQLEAGVSWDILEKPEALPHMSDTWISALMAFMNPHDIKLRLCQKKKWQSYTLNCEHDVFIMDAILKSNRFTQMEIKDINRARLIQRALTLIDITTANRTSIDPKYYKNTRDLRQDHSSWRWSSQPKITAQTLDQSASTHIQQPIPKTDQATRQMDSAHPPTRSRLLRSTGISVHAPRHERRTNSQFSYSPANQTNSRSRIRS
jgi:hypothetical protein